MKALSDHFGVHVSQVFLIHIYELVLSDLPPISQDILLGKLVQLETWHDNLSSEKCVTSHTDISVTLLFCMYTLWEIY